MTSRRVRRVTAALVAVIALAVADAPASHAAAPVALGWWTSARVNATPVGVGSTVRDGAIQVAYGAGGPVSVAAVRLAAGDGGASLTLPLDRTSTPLPFTVVACPTTSAWQHVNGGALSDAPKWDCKLGTTSSAFDPVGNTLTWQFDASFVRDGAVDVALLPIAGSQPFVATSTVPGPDAARPLGPPADQPTATLPATVSMPESPTATVAAPIGSPAPTRRALSMPPSPPAAAPTAAAALSPLPTTAQLQLPSAVRSGAPTLGRALGLLLLFAAAAVAAGTAFGFPFPWVDRDDLAPRGVGRFRTARPSAPEPL